MAKQPHWEYFYYGPKHPPPPARFPWLRDAILATVVGTLLGIVIGLRLALGYWTMATVYFVPAVVIHVLIVGFGQLFKATRRTQGDASHARRLPANGLVGSCGRSRGRNDYLAPRWVTSTVLSPTATSRPTDVLYTGAKASSRAGLTAT